MNTITAGSKHGVEVVSLPDGEQYKSLEVLQQVWDKALQSRLDRNSTFIALGGGVIGDMCGFAAAAYQRGVHFIQVCPNMISRMLVSRSTKLHKLIWLLQLSLDPPNFCCLLALLAAVSATIQTGTLI